MSEADYPPQRGWASSDQFNRSLSPSLSLSSVPSLCRPPFLSYSLSVLCLGFPGDTVVKNLPANADRDAGDLGWIPELGRSPGVGNGNPLQSRLENPMDRGAWWVRKDSENIPALPYQKWPVGISL